MKALLSICMLLIIPVFGMSDDLLNGKKIFEGRCQTCHSIGKGKVVGPDLQGIHERQSVEWITSFVQNSTKLIESGDKYAKAIFDEYDQIMMPPHMDLKEQDVKDILVYIKDVEDKLSAEAEAEVAAPAQNSPKELKAQVSAGGTESFIFRVLTGVIIFLGLAVSYMIIKIMKTLSYMRKHSDGK